MELTREVGVFLFIYFSSLSDFLDCYGILKDISHSLFYSLFISWDEVFLSSTHYYFKAF
jgi:hypothetical protein